jgi:nicotinamidase-related amidase
MRSFDSPKTLQECAMYSPNSPFAEKLTEDNAALVMVDHQTGLFQFLPSVEPMKLRHGVLALAEVGKRFSLPTVLTTSWAQGPNGPTMPELTAMFPDHPVTERDTVDVWSHAETVKAIRATGRKKLIIAALDTTTCLSFAAIGAVRAGFDAYAVVDASSTFDELNQQAAMHRLASAGVVVTTWVPVLAELAANTVRNGVHIADLLTSHTGSYAGAFSNFAMTARNASVVQAQLQAARAASDAWR